MTLYGIDIAKYQGGLSLAKVKAEGFAWVEARASTGYSKEPVDPSFAGFRAAARVAGIPLVAYHFLYSHRTVSIASQAATCAKAIGDPSIPVMIDHETADGTGTPTLADAVAFAEAMRGHGYRVPLWYLPHWVWQQIGSPAIPTNTGMSLVASSYVSGSGYASSIYPGDAQWPAAYGGLVPVIWQFTDKALVAGQHVDADAFRGAPADLQALLSSGGSTNPTPAVTPDVLEVLMTLPGAPKTYLALLADLQRSMVSALESPAGQAAIAKAVLGDNIPNHFGGDPSVASMLAYIDDHVGQLLTILTNQKGTTP